MNHDNSGSRTTNRLPEPNGRPNREPIHISAALEEALSQCLPDLKWTASATKAKGYKGLEPSVWSRPSPKSATTQPPLTTQDEESNHHAFAELAHHAY